MVQGLWQAPKACYKLQAETSELRKWEVHKPRGMQPGPRTDVIKLNQIIGPCYIQQDPVNADFVYYNHWIGNTIDSE